LGLQRLFLLGGRRELVWDYPWFIPLSKHEPSLL
jgi:hypothetical protein